MKALYYRGKDLISKQDAKDIVRYFGTPKKTPYNWIDELEVDLNYGFADERLTDLFAVIQCDRKLNEMEASIRERISKGLTESDSRSYKYVEQGLIYKLIEEAQRIEKREWNLYEKWSEVWRHFGIPYIPEYKKALEKAKEKTEGIEKPKEMYFTSQSYGICGQTDTYKLYNLELKKSAMYKIFDGDIIEKIYDKLPYVGKIYHVWHGVGEIYKTEENHIQIYVYDLANRHWAFNNAIHELIKAKIISKKDIKDL